MEVTADPGAAAAAGPTCRVAICLTTHARVDCARIGMEIIRQNYPGEWKIVHACSGPGYEPYLEDDFVRCDPRPLTAGALNLLLQSFRRAVDRWNPDYLIHLEGDTWILDHGVLLRYMGKLQQDPRALIAASSWSVDKLDLWRWRWQEEHSLLSALKVGLARLLRPLGVAFGLRERDTLSTQFFIAKNTPALMQTLESLDPAGGYILENTLYQRMIERNGPGSIIPMVEREPVRPHHRWICEGLSLYGQHWPTTVPNPKPGHAPDPGSHYDIPGKRETLQQHPQLRGGPHLQRLLTDPDLSYYNGNANRF